MTIHLTDIDHVGIAVANLEAAMAEHRPAPRPGSRNTLIAFVHPASMCGVLVELVQERG